MVHRHIFLLNLYFELIQLDFQIVEQNLFYHPFILYQHIQYLFLNVLIALLQNIVQNLNRFINQLRIIRILQLLYTQSSDSTLMILDLHLF